MGQSVSLTNRRPSTDFYRNFYRTIRTGQYDGAQGEAVEVLVAPLDHVRHPEMIEYAIPIDQLDKVFDWGA